MGGLTDQLLYRIYWFLFEWNLNAITWKAIITVAAIWIVDTLFLTGLIGNIIVVCFLGFIALVALIPYAPTVVGAADKANFIDLTEEQSMVRRVFSVIFSDVTEYVETLVDYLFGD
ncbi:hypothetical protein [Haloarcula brevis]|uniref:hypothetical protein n=1 Tax=Haloarcula brevis TaxID=3111453 RepID=UPI00300F2BFB